ncbi:ATP synthase F0 subcomplex A subunit [Longilinea arvoryzae]|uniref:ATP synthase subunit a n=1 Tax=Longilinea arvoryzae TaxID=360412 RepID=A0A0S7BI51_9CHLR|nr:FoF1 ATP synthase subunit a [Longilinea arvoryzae]GAP15273.1 ATP synthase F0 subcomplex A subunit [Longilinea arvoryzae]
MEKTRKWRWGVNRWIILGLIVLSVITSRAFPPVRPEIALAPEALTPEITLPIIGNFALTNTMVAMLIGDIILIALALTVRGAVKKAEETGELIPRKKLAGAVEMLIEYLYNMTEGTAGKWAKQIFPFFVSITFLVLIANWMELIPGVDSIGFIHATTSEGHQIASVLGGIPYLTTTVAGEGQTGYTLVPFVRTLSTDLNFTVALALIAVVMTQVMGVRAQGMTYFTKFWNTKTFFSKPIFGLIDWVVGLLEIISEFSKVLSFSFRLFGNIFAGSVMLFVIGSLVPIFAQSIFLGLELFVGLIQALVFGMLTMTFMAQATHGHGEEQHA